MTSTQSFAVWITGLPASGKSSITKALVPLLRTAGALPAVLESDRLRSILTPGASYSPEERDRFYGQMAKLGALLVESGIPVIFDATANRRAYRDQARSMIERFIEVYVECPLDVCIARDPKGIYKAAAARQATSVPGMQTPYEPPRSPEIVLDCRSDPGEGARQVAVKLKQLEYLL